VRDGNKRLEEAANEYIRLVEQKKEHEFADKALRRQLEAMAGGEVATVAAAAEDEVPVLVFDEVDANVGGETAHAVGQKMRQIAAQHQVLCITHLAPVAAHGDAHYVVSKSVTAGRTETRVAPIQGPGRVEELARMLGGGPAARRHAGELLAEQTKSASSAARKK